MLVITDFPPSFHLHHLHRLLADYTDSIAEIRLLRESAAQRSSEANAKLFNDGPEALSATDLLDQVSHVTDDEKSADSHSRPRAVVAFKTSAAGFATSLFHDFKFEHATHKEPHVLF